LFKDCEEIKIEFGVAQPTTTYPSWINAYPLGNTDVPDGIFTPN